MTFLIMLKLIALLFTGLGVFGVFCMAGDAISRDPYSNIFISTLIGLLLFSIGLVLAFYLVQKEYIYFFDGTPQATQKEQK